MMPEYHIGSLDEASVKILAEGDTGPVSDEPRPIFLDSKAWIKAPLHAKSKVSWDTRIFSFKLQHEEQQFGLPTGQHVMLRAKDLQTGESVIRSYTPISETAAVGFLDVLVKVYFDSPQQKGGKMTLALDALEIGGTIDFKGPIGKFTYLGKGKCSINGTERHVSRFYMICGGSGVTPIYQVFRAVMQDPEDETHCVVLDGNRMEEDILCREELDYFSSRNEKKCKLIYTLTKATDDWKGLKGRIDTKLLNEHIENDEKAMVLICGPEALEKAVHKVLQANGWKDEQILFF
jgi:nitrate reductase (NAD(P)H)